MLGWVRRRRLAESDRMQRNGPEREDDDAGHQEDAPPKKSWWEPSG